MTVAVSDFRTAFPEFADATTFADAQVAMWLGAAYLQLNARRFGASLDLAAMLFVAHNLTLGAREARAAASGGLPGQAVAGPMTAKAVDKVSVSYGAGAAREGAGAWNLTTYGQRLYAMMRAFTGGMTYAPGMRPVFDPMRAW